MIAFAGNSLICRLALRDESIDPASFTSIRLAAGAITLMFIFLAVRRGDRLRGHGSWQSALVLFVYAITFSLAYVSLNAGTGALILFGTVQGTMIIAGLRAGDRPAALEWVGWSAAFAGLVWLLLPGIEAPPLTGSVLMATAGVTWGIYSLRGKRESNALAANASNFLLSLLMALLMTVFVARGAEVTSRGLWLAVLSGAATSGLGYVIWYRALEYLSAMQAALVQLSVPAIAMAGGVVLLDEHMTSRLAVSSALVLGGICLALAHHRTPT